MDQFAGRIESLRSIMRSRGWDAVIISGSDPHSSEYVSPRWRQVEWLSGFTGEGDIVVTDDHAGLWTDTRYFIQADRQLAGTGIELHKTCVPDQVLIPQWLSSRFPSSEEGPTVAIDGLCEKMSFVDSLDRKFNVVDVPNLPDLVWEDRPAAPQSPIITLGEEQVGWSREHKISWLRKKLMQSGCDAIFLTALDEIAWLLNVRGADVEYNPVVLSYLLVTMDDVDWYVRKFPPSRDPETQDSFYELKADGVAVKDYDDVGLDLAALADDDSVGRLWIDPSTLNYNLYKVLESVSADLELVRGRSPIALRKAVKNEVEIAGMKEAHVEDGAVMERFLWWLERQLSLDSGITEYDAARKLSSLRAEVEGYRGDSFQTISAYGPNAALPHYVTPVSGSALLEPRGLYLVDSGGQYVFGTTDITRTVPLGPCTDLEKEDYTLVLKGHIDLAMAVFPKGTAGCHLDVLAREPLWHSKRNFGHGTGHGVGFYLNVHEGPQDIRPGFNRQPLLPGMITSDEPGIYREGRFGVRHENLILTVSAGDNDFGSWLRFEPLTLCHFDTSAIVPGLLSQEEKDWLNSYNRRVFDTLSPLLGKEISAWLQEKTRPI